MSRVITLLVLSSSIAYGQATVASGKCRTRQPLTTYWYTQAVLNQLAPPQPVDSHTVIDVGASWTGGAKLVLRTDGKVFEIFRGTLEQNLYRSLDELDKSCKLPSDPAQAAKLIRVRWERSVITSALFAEIMHDFETALSQYSTTIESNSSQLLKMGGSYISIHAPEYTISYQNGAQRLQITDSQALPNQIDPMIEWAQMFERIADKQLQERP